MAIIRWDPLREMETFRERMNRLFNETFTGREEDTDIKSGIWSPVVDIHESDKNLVLTAELPGLKEEDVEVNIDGNTLSISGKREFEEETKKDDYHRIERSYGSFFRSFTLPSYIDQEKVKAEYDNGLLKVTMPKKPELKPKKVKVLKGAESKKK
jgi:HSP20 family protein